MDTEDGRVSKKVSSFLARKFRRLWQVWNIVSQDEFILSEIFPPEKLIDINLIQPPKRRKPRSFEKKTFPLMRPEDVIRNRTMSLVPFEGIDPLGKKMSIT